MSVWRLGFAYLCDRWLNSVLLLLLLALGIATITLLLLFDGAMRERLARDARGIDLVVGAKGSPLQLLLSAVYHLDVPTGNIPAETATRLAAHPMVSKVIPLALGDSLAGFRIVGTDHGYAKHYGAVLAEGRLWNSELEAVLGADVARATGLGPGDSFIGSHGLTPGGPAHSQAPYRVVGVLSPSASVLDRLVLTAVQSIWEVHDHHETVGKRENIPREITALLVAYRTPLAAVRLPREINVETALQAASPALEMARLLSLVGAALRTLRGFGVLLIVTAGLGIFVALTTALRERRQDIAILRSLGASRMRVLCLMLSEALSLSAAGGVAGLALGHIAAETLAGLMPEARAMGLTGTVARPDELYLMAFAIGIGALAALLPALTAYRTEVAATLSSG